MGLGSAKCCAHKIWGRGRDGDREDERDGCVMQPMRHPFRFRAVSVELCKEESARKTQWRGGTFQAPKSTPWQPPQPLSAGVPQPFATAIAVGTLKMYYEAASVVYCRTPGKSRGRTRQWCALEGPRCLRGGWC